MALPYAPHIRFKALPLGGAGPLPPAEVEIDYPGLFLGAVNGSITSIDNFDPVPPAVGGEKGLLDQAFQKLLQGAEKDQLKAYLDHIANNITAGTVARKELEDLSAKLANPVAEPIDNLIENFRMCIKRLKMLSESPTYPLIKAKLINTILPGAIAAAGIVPPAAPVVPTAPIVITATGTGGVDPWDALRRVLELVKTDLNATHAAAIPKYTVDDSVADKYELSGGARPATPEVGIIAHKTATGFTLTMQPTNDNTNALKEIIDKAPAEGLKLTYTVKQCPGGPDGLKQALKVAAENPKIRFAQAVIDQFTAEFEPAPGAMGPHLPNPEWDQLKLKFAEPDRSASHRMGRPI